MIRSSPSLILLLSKTHSQIFPRTHCHTHTHTHTCVCMPSLLKTQGQAPSRSPREAKVRTGRTLSGQREVMLGGTSLPEASGTHKGTHTWEHPHISTQTCTHIFTQKRKPPFPSYRQPGGVRFGELLTISVLLAHFALPHPPYPSQLVQHLLPALTSSRKFPGWQVCAHRCILHECVDMWFATEEDNVCV